MTCSSSCVKPCHYSYYFEYFRASLSDPSCLSYMIVLCMQTKTLVYTRYVKVKLCKQDTLKTTVQLLKDFTSCCNKQYPKYQEIGMEKSKNPYTLYQNIESINVKTISNIKSLKFSIEQSLPCCLQKNIRNSRGKCFRIVYLYRHRIDWHFFTLALSTMLTKTPMGMVGHPYILTSRNSFLSIYVI